MTSFNEEDFFRLTVMTSYENNRLHKKYNIFMMGKRTKCNNHKKENNQSHPKSIPGVYFKELKKREPNCSKRPTCPKNHLYPNHVKKSSKDLSVPPLCLSVPPLCTLDQPHKLQMKELFNLYSEKTALSKVTLFLSRQTIQKRQRGRG